MPRPNANGSYLCPNSAVSAATARQRAPEGAGTGAIGGRVAAYVLFDNLVDRRGSRRRGRGAAVAVRAAFFVLQQRHHVGRRYQRRRRRRRRRPVDRLGFRRRTRRSELRSSPSSMPHSSPTSAFPKPFAARDPRAGEATSSCASTLRASQRQVRKHGRAKAVFLASRVQAEARPRSRSHCAHLRELSDTVSGLGTAGATRSRRQCRPSARRPSLLHSRAIAHLRLR